MSPRSKRSLALLGHALCLAACGGGGASAPAKVVIEAPAVEAPAADPCARAASRLFGTLRTPMTITAYLSRGTRGLDRFGDDLRAMLDEAARLSSGKLSVRYVVDAVDAQRQQALDDGVQETTFAEGDPDNKNRAQVVKGFLGLSFRHGAEREAIPRLSPAEGQSARFWILNKVRELRDRVDGPRHRIGLLTGHDEIALAEPNLTVRGQGHAPSIRGVMEAALPYFELRDVDLREGKSAIDPSLEGLVITQPANDLSSNDLRRIDQFVMLGDKALVIYAGAVNVRAGDASITATLSTHGLEALSAGYGIEMKKAAILDWARPMRLPVETEDRKLMLVYPPVLHVEIDDKEDAKARGFDPTFAAFFRLDELVFPFASPLVPHPERQPGATMRTVAQSSPRATTLTEDGLSLRVTNEWRPSGPLGAHAIAVVVEGAIKSAFGAGTIEGITLPSETQAGPSRVLVVASSQFLANPLARAGNPPPLPPQMAMMGTPPGDEELQLLAMPYAKSFLTGTILAFKNTLDWMINPPELRACANEPWGK